MSSTSAATPDSITAQRDRLGRALDAVAGQLSAISDTLTDAENGTVEEFSISSLIDSAEEAKDDAEDALLAVLIEVGTRSDEGVEWTDAAGESVFGCSHEEIAQRQATQVV